MRVLKFHGPRDHPDAVATTSNGDAIPEGTVPKGLKGPQTLECLSTAVSADLHGTPADSTMLSLLLDSNPAE